MAKKTKRSKGRTRKYNSSSDVIDIEEARTKRQNKRDKKRTKREKPKRTKRNKRNKIKREGPMSPRQKKQLIKKIIGYVIVAVILFTTIGYQGYRILNLKAEESKLKKEQIELMETKKKLADEAGNKDNTKYIEQQARKQLNLVMPGEILYVLPEEKTDEED